MTPDRPAPTDPDLQPRRQAGVKARPVNAAAARIAVLVGVLVSIAASITLALGAMPASAATGTTASAPATATRSPSEPIVRVGSKRFTESYVLGEILVGAIAGGGGRAEHRQGLGNTAIVLGALEAGSIDVYPEYTGTIAREILKLDAVPSLAELNSALAARGLQVAVPLGFNNGYALAVRGDDARTRGLQRLSDLAAHPTLRLGMTQEFIGRADGWPGLKAAYGLPFATPRGLDHGIAYEAIRAGQVDVIDVYTTDAKIDRYGLFVLADDRHYFPGYDAVLLHRADLATRAPLAWQALTRLAGTLDEHEMQRLNAEAEIDKRPFAAIARSWLDRQEASATSSTDVAAGTPSLAASSSAASSPAASSPAELSPAGTSTTTPATAPAAGPPAASAGPGFLDRLFADDFGRLTGQHLMLVISSVSAGVLIGLPLGVLAARHPALSQGVIATVGVIQTIPSLALLAFLIPLTGRIGVVPAFIALVLYSLLPIVRNTHAGLLEVKAGVKEAGRSLGLSPNQVLRLIELPMAAPTILAGVKTSAVINVGTATIAAFIGAGGYGERIVTGLALNDHATLLAGAVPAAALALLIEGGFSIIERLHRRQSS